MQTALKFAPPSFPPLLTPSKTSAATPLTTRRRSISMSRYGPQIKADAVVASDNNPTADYSSPTSVFPAEACETIGGEACDAEMYPEVKLKPESKTNSPTKTSSEKVDREYLEYDNPKTVFPGEACDDLGGEFCEPEYQSGVY
ncbi:unnamed protein product [Ilex paraguariensis]|uniref:Light-regulated protein n=1 Tax=Ilex paraguariensis TaxID=185542 RepID=A0ABC8RN07_9AQUA